MDAIYRIQEVIRARIANSYTNFKKKSAAKMTRDGALTRLEDLEAQYIEFMKNDNEFITLEEFDTSHNYIRTKLSEIVYETYLDVKSEYKTFLNSFDSPNPFTPATVAVPSQITVNNSLPKIEIEVFNGNLQDWPRWRDLYKSLIHQKQDMSSILKFCHLSKALDDEPKSLIKHISLSDDNYLRAWSTLTDHYDNKRRLINQTIFNFLLVEKMSSESYLELKRLKDATFDCLEHFSLLDRKIEGVGVDLVIYHTVNRFDSTTRREWEKLLGNSTDPPTITELKDFLKMQLATLSNLRDNERLLKPSSKKSVKAHATDTDRRGKRTYTCPLCNSAHGLWACSQFKSKSVHERHAYVKSSRLCYNCFGSHPANKCPSTRRCNTCDGKHNTLLHIAPSTGNVSAVDAKSSPQSLSVDDKASCKTEEVAVVASCTSPLQSFSVNSRCKFVLLSTALIKVKTRNGDSMLVRALVDQCSQSSFISEALCQRIGLQRRHSGILINGVGDATSCRTKGVVTFSFSSRFDEKFKFTVTAQILSKVSGYCVTQMPGLDTWNHLHGIQLADPQFLEFSSIDVLLGSELHAQIVEGLVLKGAIHEPIATKTKLGWIVSGMVGNAQSNAPASSHCTSVQLVELMTKFWTVEEVVPTKKLMSKDEVYCEEFFARTYTQDVSGKFVVRLPFKPNVLDKLTINLSDSYSKAEKTLHAMERKFRKDSLFKEKYVQFMREYEQLGHLSPWPKSKPISSNSYFLPHHGVLKGDKLRTVFNGSAKINGISLNDLLLPGPRLVPDLFDIIIRWRRYRFVFVTDIEKMFRQVLVHPDDRQFQLILWRESEADEIRILILNTVTYGLTSSPYLASKSIIQLAKDRGHKFPLAVLIILVLREAFVDDFASGEDTVEEAKERQVQLMELLKVGGFPLRKWAANTPELEDWLPDSHRQRDSSLKFEEHDSTSILGLSWSPLEDCFSFKISLQTFASDHLTKRLALSMIARLFDPIGWLAPVVITAKIFMQSLWLLKCDWDDDLPPNYTEKWIDFYNKLPALSKIRIPRWINFLKSDRLIELHGFGDASTRAYAAVLYIRIIREENVSITFQCAKTRVAPTKTVSVPRLELCAAELLTKLAHHFMKTMPFEFSSVHLWSDSKDVLYWIREQPVRWTTFVANRCSNIQTLLPTAYWHHVGTADNPADLASRGIDPLFLESNQLWFSGPSFLGNRLGSWPTLADEISTNSPLEERKTVLSSSQTRGFDDTDWSILRRFSSLAPLLKFTSVYIRFIIGFRSRLSPKNVDKLRLFKLAFIRLDLNHGDVISAQERERAECLWTHLVQQASYSFEFEMLNASKIPKGSRILNLNPFIDCDLIRTGGRLRHSPLAYQEKFPLILPRESYFTRLIVLDMHHRCLHGGVQVTTCSLKVKYWIPRAKLVIQQVIRNCTICLRYSARVPHQLMGDLPKERCNIAFPFENSGLDFAGPFRVRLSKSRGRITTKAYLCIFVCLSTKAVHIEVVEDYTSNAFIAAFSRFVDRRGPCKLLRSDQGTNFIGADRELREMFSEASAEYKDITTKMAELSTTWEFNPPAAPHFGGLWEAAVKSTKYHLKRILGDHVLTVVELSTLCCKIESILNSRPLIKMPEGDRDFTCLTPAHFLIQRTSFLVPEPTRNWEKVSYAKRYEWITGMAQRFWNLWSQSYLKTLQERQKWRSPTANFKVGDVVLIRNNLSPPCEWPMGIISKLHQGSDDCVRVVDVRTASSTLTRPIVKLVALVSPD